MNNAYALIYTAILGNAFSVVDTELIAPGNLRLKTVEGGLISVDIVGREISILNAHITLNKLGRGMFLNTITKNSGFKYFICGCTIVEK